MEICWWHQERLCIHCSDLWDTQLSGVGDILLKRWLLKCLIIHETGKETPHIHNSANSHQRALSINTVLHRIWSLNGHVLAIFWADLAHSLFRSSWTQLYASIEFYSGDGLLIGHSSLMMEKTVHVHCSGVQEAELFDLVEFNLEDGFETVVH